jgi:acylphosphatase
MIRLTAYISGKVRFAGYEDQLVFLAKETGLVGLVQNRSDGRVLVIHHHQCGEHQHQIHSWIRRVLNYPKDPWSR